MVHEKTAARGILAFVLSVCLLWASLPSAPARASVDIGGIQWGNNNSAASSSFTFMDKRADGVQNYGNTYEFTRRVEDTVFFSFFAESTIFKYPVTVLSYSFFLYTAGSPSVSNLSSELFLIVNGTEYPLSGVSGWLNKLYIYGGATYITVKMRYSCDLTYRVSLSSDMARSSTHSVRLSLRMDAFDQYPASDNVSVMNDKLDEILRNGSNAAVTEAINSQTGVIEEGNRLQEEANELQREENETQKNIFDKISEFFNGFFDNIISTVVSLVIPSSEEVTAFLDEVNGWFGARLGFVWYPFDLAVRLVSALSQGEASRTFAVPSLTLHILGEDYVIWNAVEADMDAFGIFVYVRWFTSALLVSAVVSLAVRKWDEWIGGHDG